MFRNISRLQIFLSISITLVLVLVFVALVATIPVHAQENFIPSEQTESFNNRTQIRIRLKALLEATDKLLSADERTALIAQFKLLAANKRCELRQRNMSARIELYAIGRDEQAALLRTLIQNLQTAVERNKRLNLETSGLTKHIEELTKYADKLRNEYFKLDEVMDVLIQSACDITKLDNPEIKTAQSQLELIRKTANDARSYIKDKLIADTLQKEFPIVSSSSSSTTSAN
jgi:hypothetical protein